MSKYRRLHSTISLLADFDGGHDRNCHHEEGMAVSVYGDGFYCVACGASMYIVVA